jgi:hypothetical protein
MNKATAFIPPHALNTAVLFLVFNRLDTTKQVFEAIRQAKPPRLYIAADGAREVKVGETEKVKAVREYIMSNIDWECEVKTLFRNENLGCGFAPASAITWFFENEEMGIILEDDCLPSQSFFWFCEELLERYKNDMRIFLISGYNKQNSWEEKKNDYFFSNLGGIWGWASWRRAWEYYDIEMSDIENFIENNNFVNIFGEKFGKIRQDTIYKSIIINKMDAWDYQWAYARHKNNGLACVPMKSLIENIGFGDDATHTFGDNQDNVNKYEISFPLKENDFIVPDRNYDEKFLQKNNILRKILERLTKNF